MTEKELLYEVKGRAAWLTLNREERRNAISMGMIDLFNSYLDQAEKDEAIRALCITNAGEKVFCSGADLDSAMAGGGPESGPMKYAGLLKRMVAFPKPLVARLNGHCLAGGMGLMLACDMAYAREGIKIGAPEVKVGLFPMMIGALIFRNAVRKKALEMIFTAELLNTDEAEAMGLITRAYPAEELDGAVDAKLEAIVKNAPVAIQIGRKALAEVEDMPFDEAIDRLCERLGEVIKTEDAMEGLAAFLQKREPQWKGR